VIDCQVFVDVTCIPEERRKQYLDDVHDWYMGQISIMAQSDYSVH